MPFDVLNRFLRPLRSKRVTSRYPAEAPDLASAARGLPMLDVVRCDGNAACVASCPTGAIKLESAIWSLDAGACIFCGACARACPEKAIHLGHEIELAVLDPDDLIVQRSLRMRR